MGRNVGKRWFSMLLCACVVFSGCGKTDGEEASNENTTTESGVSGQEESADEGQYNLIVTADMADFKEDDEYADWKNQDCTEILLDGNTVKTSGKGTGTTVDGSIVTINQGGTYVISGALEDGQIVVNAADTEKVRLVLNEAQISCAQGPAILCLSADKLTISLEEGTKNTVSDGSTQDSEDYTAAVYSKADLVWNGTGSLAVNGNYNNAVQSKDDLRIIDGTYEINSVDDGLVGKDKVAIKDGVFTIRADGDAIKSTNSEDPERGFIYIGGGIYTIEAGSNGIQAKNGILTEDGDFTVNAAQDTIHSDGTITVDGGTFSFHAGDDGVHADGQLILNDGTFLIATCVEGLESPDLIINGGEYDITASDDGINGAGGELDTAQMEGQMPGGMEMPEDGRRPEKPYGMELSEDGQMPDGMEPPEDGQMPDGMEPPEDGQMPDGMEPPEDGQMPEDSGSVKSGMRDRTNGTGKDNSTGDFNRKGMGGGRMGGGMGAFSSSSGTLTITGGNIIVRSEGDGIDVNGSVTMTGGSVIVEGPTNSGNGALDYDGSFLVDGGEILAVGSSGMMQTLSAESKVPFLTVVFEKQSAGQSIEVRDSSGNVVAKHTPSKSYESLVFGSEKLTNGETYGIYVGNTLLKEVQVS